MRASESYMVNLRRNIMGQGSIFSEFLRSFVHSKQAAKLAGAYYQRSSLALKPLP